MVVKLMGIAVLAAALGACSNSGSRYAPRGPGEPMAPSAAAPTGSVNSRATGGGVPTPLQPGGAGGVGSGNQPGRAGTR
jgi:hypothetical protein